MPFLISHVSIWSDNPFSSSQASVGHEVTVEVSVQMNTPDTEATQIDSTPSIDVRLQCSFFLLYVSFLFLAVFLLLLLLSLSLSPVAACLCPKLGFELACIMLARLVCFSFH